MKIIDQKLDYSKHWSLPDVYLFTGNATVKKGDALVMGRGAALQVRNSYPGIDKHFGLKIKFASNKHIHWAAVHPNAVIPAEQYIGWFKVKNHWRDKAELNIIHHSCKELERQAKMYFNYQFHMNYPGIGYGGLTLEEVAPLLRILPDNVTLYR
jgi:hypothetical protein